LSVSYGRTLAAATLTILILGAVAGAAVSAGGARTTSGTEPGYQDTWRGVLGDAAGHALAAVAGTVDGVAANREARRAYRRDPSYVSPFPAPYYPYPNGYPYW
jgi:hypothetical protein